MKKMEHAMADYESLQQAKKIILPRRIIGKTAEYFFDQSVSLKDLEIRNYSERIIHKLDFLLLKLEKKISGSMTATEVFDVLLTVLAENDIN